MMSATLALTSMRKRKYRMLRGFRRRLSSVVSNHSSPTRPETWKAMEARIIGTP
jgi:hypothetical protein